MDPEFVREEVARGRARFLVFLVWVLGGLELQIFGNSLGFRV